MFAGLPAGQKCGQDADYWLNHRNFAEVNPLPSGQVNVKVWFEAESKYSAKPLLSYDTDIPALKLLSH